MGRITTIRMLSRSPVDCPDENWDAADEDDESRYHRAVDCVRRKIIGWTTTINGKRAVLINGRPHYDEEVFVRAWGRDAAADIMSGKPR